jgi:hypothetical protein
MHLLAPQLTVGCFPSCHRLRPMSYSWIEHHGTDGNSFSIPATVPLRNALEMSKGSPSRLLVISPAVLHSSENVLR